ncbi:hypothetical protein L1987_77323 [Smallanthus sonchifolius]|uniref:Uncharacterized protein n=1 Tax=Smallanthus sonchifolius TaxID=185202 RepID=A0ACB8Z9V3_9ASTR|nr:hypothetical protein L1987_77323 [Smallanthus sonchifolius]
MFINDMCILVLFYVGKIVAFSMLCAIYLMKECCSYSLNLREFVEYNPAILQTKNIVSLVTDLFSVT